MSLIKLITESFNEKENNLKNTQKHPIIESKLTIEELDNLILECTNNLTSIKVKYNDLKSTWKSLKEDLQTFSFYNHLTDNNSIKEQFQKAIDELKLEYSDTKKTLDIYKEQKNKLLLEDTSKENNDINDNILKDKYFPIVKNIESMINSSNIYDLFEYMFNSLVPKYGESETKAGEIIRALMKIMYNALNSNYVFYEGTGKEILKNAVKFLKSMGYEDYLNEVIGLTGDDYLNAMEKLIEKVIRDIISSDFEEFFYTKNEIDFELI